MFREFAGLLKRVSAAAGVASLVAFAGQANAASYVGSWDPAFGSAFPNLGWRGEAVFVIPDACLAVDGIYTNGSTCANGGLQITSAVVEFYNLSAPPAIGSPIGQNVTGVLDTLYFVQPSLTITMDVRGGELFGVIGTFLTFDTSSIPLVTAMGYNGASATFGLGFRDDPLFSGNAYYAQMGWTQDRPCRFFVHCTKFGKSDLQNSSGGSFLTFERILAVPEPGSLALLLPAIGMLAAFRRRKPAPAAA
jgi:hypothetical protein